MNSIPFYRDFGVAGELAHRPRGEPAPARRGLLAESSMPSSARASARPIAKSPGSPGTLVTAIPVAGSPTKLSAVCLNV